MSDQIVILIPALEPPTSLISFCKELTDDGSLQILVVDDGSNHSKAIFEELDLTENVTIIANEENLGKGAALKVGFEFVQRSPWRDCLGVITVDADGQHSLEDVRRMIVAAKRDPSTFVIGRRLGSTSASQVPLRSYIGNLITKYIFQVASGIGLSDSQCGLRFYPSQTIGVLGEIKSEKYDFETEVFFALKSHGTLMKEIDIKKLYFENNDSSHFRPFIDSMRICWVFFRHTYISVLAALIDFFVFYSFWLLTDNSFISICFSRGLALAFYIYGLSNFAYHTKITKRIVLQVCLLVLMSVIVVPYLINFAFVYFENIILSKIISESIWFFFNFFILRKVVFKND